MKFNLGSDRTQAYIHISLIYSYFNIYDLRISLHQFQLAKAKNKQMKIISPKRIGISGRETFCGCHFGFTWSSWHPFLFRISERWIQRGVKT